MEPEGWCQSELPSVSLLFLATHRGQYLSSAEFKEKMYHIVDDLAGPARTVPVRWVMATKWARHEPNKPE